MDTEDYSKMCHNSSLQVKIWSWNIPNIWSLLLIPVAVPSKVQAFGGVLAGIMGSNPTRGMDVCLLWLFLCFQVEVSVTDWSLVQRSPTERGVLKCDLESSKRRWPRPNLGCCTTGRKEGRRGSLVYLTTYVFGLTADTCSRMWAVSWEGSISRINELIGSGKWQTWDKLMALYYTGVPPTQMQSSEMSDALSAITVCHNSVVWSNRTDPMWRFHLWTVDKIIYDGIHHKRYRWYN
jgi:hypothetical protein